MCAEGGTAAVHASGQFGGAPASEQAAASLLRAPRTWPPITRPEVAASELPAARTRGVERVGGARRLHTATKGRRGRAVGRAAGGGSGGGQQLLCRVVICWQIMLDSLPTGCCAAGPEWPSLLRECDGHRREWADFI